MNTWPFRVLIFAAWHVIGPGADRDLPEKPAPKDPPEYKDYEP